MIEGESVVHEVTFAHPPERVWHALVDQGELRVWLMENDFVPVVGARFTMDCGPIGLVQGEVLEIDPPRRLSSRWRGVFGDTLVTFVLTPVESGTHVRMEHRGWGDADAAARDQFDGGWPTKFAGLHAVLDGVAPLAEGVGELE